MTAALSDFEAATAVEQVGERAFRAVIPDEWQQGRGAFGGLVLGMLLRSIVRSEPDSQRVARTLAGDICGPVLPGPAEIQVRELRRGSNQSNFAAELTQGGAVLSIASAVLSRARRSARRFTRATPPAPDDWQSASVLPIAAPLGPVFAQHYEYRLAGPGPFAGHPVPEIGGWIREKTLLPRLDAPALIGRIDAWFPTLFIIESQPRPMATVQFTAEILADPSSLDPALPLRYRAEMISSRDGFLLESRELWRGEELVALNQQTFAILK